MTSPKSENTPGAAALRGALTGLIFALAEYAFAILEPMLRWGPRATGPEHWYWESIFLLFYMICGAAIGLLLTLPPLTRFRPAVPQAVVAVAWTVMAAWRLRTAGSGSVALVLDLSLALLAAFLFWGVGNGGWPGRLSWLSSPWTIIPLGFLFVKAGDWASSPLKLIAAILILTFAIAAAVLIPFQSRILHRLLDRRFIPASLLACALLLPAFVVLTLRLNAPQPLPSARAASAPGRPNIVLIVFDTVRANHLSLYGYQRHNTPNLEQLAHDSVFYRNAVSAADMTLSSYGAMYTGFYPSRHGALPNPVKDTPLEPAFVTLAETLGAQGYLSMAVLSNFGYLNRDFGLDQGFAFYDVRPVAGSLGNRHDYWLRTALRPVLDLVLETRELDRAYRSSDQITAGALRLLQSPAARSRPFFLSVNYMDAHDPCLPPAPYNSVFPGFDPAFHAEDESRMTDAILHGRRTPRVESALRHITSQYDGGIALMDAQVKIVVDRLKQLGLYDQTMIVVTSDHGQALGERGDYGHPSSVHEELVNIPLLIKYPRSFPVAPGTQVDALVSGIDLMPTVLDTAHIQPPAALPGRSLLDPGLEKERAVFSESYVGYRMAQVHRQQDGQRAVYLGPWKLISTVGQKSELYNWAADPQEAHNVYSPDDPAARRLEEELHRWQQIMPRPKSASKKTQAPEVTDRLRGLGYIH